MRTERRDAGGHDQRRSARPRRLAAPKVHALECARIRLLTDFEKMPEDKRNCVRIPFPDPSMRALYADWRAAARDCVPHLSTAAASPDDLRLTSLVGELSVQDRDFGRWWGSSHGASRRQAHEAVPLPSSVNQSSTGTPSPAVAIPIRNSPSGRWTPPCSRTTGFAPSPHGHQVGSAGPQPIRSTGLTV